MEDATSLGALLPAGTQPQDIQGRLILYNECRYTRAHQIQEYTRLAGRDAKEFKAVLEERDNTAGKAKGRGTGNVLIVTLVEPDSEISINAAMLEVYMASPFSILSIWFPKLLSDSLLIIKAYWKK